MIESEILRLEIVDEKVEIGHLVAGYAVKAD